MVSLDVRRSRGGRAFPGGPVAHLAGHGRGLVGLDVSGRGQSVNASRRATSAPAGGDSGAQQRGDGEPGNGPSRPSRRGKGRTCWREAASGPGCRDAVGSRRRRRRGTRAPCCQRGSGERERGGKEEGERERGREIGRDVYVSLDVSGRSQSRRIHPCCVAHLPGVAADARDTGLSAATRLMAGCGGLFFAVGKEKVRMR